MEAFTDAVRLRALGLGARVIDVLDREIQLILVPFGIAAELAAAVSNSISVVIEPGASYEAALILETSTETRIIATDAINANVAATAPIDRNGFFSTSRAHRSQFDECFTAEKATGYEQGCHVQPHPNRGS